MTETTQNVPEQVLEVFPTPPHTDHKSHKSASSSSDQDHKVPDGVNIRRKVESDGKVTLSVTLLVPVQQYPKYNFVGRILGPRGMTAKQLERDTGCKILVKGRGSTKSYNNNKLTRGGNYLTSLSTISQDASTNEPLNVYIECTDHESSCKKKMDHAIGIIQNLLTPPADGKDEMKRKQLIDYAIINGTFRQTSSTISRDRTIQPVSETEKKVETKRNEMRNGDGPCDDDVESMKMVKMLLDSHKYYNVEEPILENQDLVPPNIAYEPQFQDPYFHQYQAAAPPLPPMVPRQDGLFITGPYTYYPCEPQPLPSGPVYPLPQLIYMLPSNFQVFDQFIRRY